jgi:hypothetical protein
MDDGARDHICRIFHLSALVCVIDLRFYPEQQSFHVRRSATGAVIMRQARTWLCGENALPRVGHFLFYLRAVNLGIETRGVWNGEQTPTAPTFCHKSSFV